MSDLERGEKKAIDVSLFSYSQSVTLHSVAVEKIMVCKIKSVSSWKSHKQKDPLQLYREIKNKHIALLYFGFSAYEHMDEE